jgi:hypothetical protein
MKIIQQEATTMKKRTPLDLSVLVIVVAIAFIVIALSFQNTAKLAAGLGLNPYLMAGLIEILFGSLLFIRGRQRATQRNVPIFLEIGYFVSLAAVTSVNMYGLAQENALIGSIVGLAISGAMWLMESVLVWLWVDSHKPHRKSIRERMGDAREAIQEEKSIQRIEWMKWESRKPDLKLIREARKAEEKRKDTIGDGLPEYFRIEPEPIQQVIAVATEQQEEAQVISIQRQIGFLNEEKKTSKLFQPNSEAREKAIQTAQQLTGDLGRIPSKKELMETGLSDHYSRLALDAVKKD